MKVYVDEMPKSCRECPCRERNGYDYTCLLYYKKHEMLLDCEYYEDSRPNECLLQPLTDYTKQVRKEVCEEIQSELLDFTHKYWRVFKQNGKQYMTDDDLIERLNEIISQIQGETK